MDDPNSIQWHVCHLNLSHLVGSPQGFTPQWCAMSVRVFSTPAHNASVRALVRVSRPAWLILPFASSQIKYSVSIRMTLAPVSSSTNLARGRRLGSVVPYDDAFRLPSTSTLPANTSWRPCTN